MSTSFEKASIELYHLDAETEKIKKYKSLGNLVDQVPADSVKAIVEGMNALTNQTASHAIVVNRQRHTLDN
ncbi:hypothetical protein [Granulicatella seriolae]|uniref:DUF1659 domain-containing protein n=1 Tax=Granulicatella seriolae TaxID=2967226 RepID=A0ABT1WPN3_9LACT|nr:hypothetical protein [Granulicatella seriolae]